MRFKSKKIGLFLSYLLLISGCIDPYEPDLSPEDISAFVVDGFVNVTEKTVTVDLSRTLPLSADYNYEPISNANVVLEAENGTSLMLDNRGEGKYALGDLVLDASVRYRLYIDTEGNEYRSEFITLNSSPSLDEVSWEVTPESDGIQFYVNAHDPSNQTRYYQWVFTETWEYNSEFLSVVILEADSVRYREESEFVYLCWKTEESKKILIYQTTNLTDDVVHKFPIHFIAEGDQKIGRRYSILVQQRAIDKTTYNYLQLLQKTTEGMGGLFDPMPSRILGNIRNINDSAEPILGYFRGGYVQEKRLFIDRGELSGILEPYASYVCEKSVSTLDQVIENFPFDQVVSNVPGGGGFYVAPATCMDCRFGGGILTKPDFW